MIFLLVLCIAVGALLVFIPAETMLYFGLAATLIFLPIMLYVCYKKLQTIEMKIDEMNETDKSENNSKEE